MKTIQIKHILSILFVMILAGFVACEGPTGPRPDPTIDGRVVEQVKSGLAEANEALVKAIRIGAVDADMIQQLKVIQELLSEIPIERRIATGSERAFERELAVLKEIMATITEEVKEREAIMKAFEQLISAVRSGRVEADREVVRQWHVRAEEEKEKIETAQQTIDAIRVAAEALEAARQAIKD